MIIDRLNLSFDISLSPNEEVLSGFTMRVLPMVIPYDGVIKAFYKVGDIEVELTEDTWDLVTADGGYDLVLNGSAFPNSGQIILRIYRENDYGFYGDSTYEDEDYIQILGGDGLPPEFTDISCSYELDGEYIPIDKDKVTHSFCTYNEDLGRYTFNSLAFHPGIVPDPEEYYNLKINTTWEYPIEFTINNDSTVSYSQEARGNVFNTIWDPVELGEVIEADFSLEYLYWEGDVVTSNSFAYYDFDIGVFTVLAEGSYTLTNYDETFQVTYESLFSHPNSSSAIPTQIISQRTGPASSVVVSGYPSFTLISDMQWGYGEYYYGDT